MSRTANLMRYTRTLAFIATGWLSFACHQQESISLPEPNAAQSTQETDNLEGQKPEQIDDQAPTPNGPDPIGNPDLPDAVIEEPIKPADPIIPVEPTPEVPKPVDPVKPVETTPVVVVPKPVDPPVVTPPTVKRYMIIGYGSNRCITSPEAVGVQFEIRDCTRAPNQLFTLEQVATNTMKIITHKNHVMEIRSDSLSDGAIVQSGSFLGRRTQLWRVEPKNFIDYESLNVVDTTYTLDALEKGTANGTKIQIWRTDFPNTNQRWIIQEN